MSKKKLLSENEIRRFQGLAGIPAIGEGIDIWRRRCRVPIEPRVSIT